MKKAVLFAVVAMLLAICLPAFAQEFPDVPPDHWAYDAVQQLVNAGIVQGYPDGTYGGKRAMTRYEFAEAVAKLLPWVEEKIKEIPAGGGTGVGPAGPAGPAGSPGVTPEQLAAMQKLIDEFRDELAALGVDVEALRRDVAALNERVTALEAEVARVRFTGEANFIGRGEVANTPLPTFDMDSRVLAAHTVTPETRKNPLSNCNFFTDLDFGMKARVSENSSVNALIAAGNYFQNFAFANAVGFPSAEVDDFTLWNLYLDGAMKLGPLGAAQVIVGRYPFQLTPLTLKFVNPDSYAMVTKLSSGDYVLDGGRASFNFGKVALTAFAGKAQPIADLISPDLMMFAPVDTEVSQLAGARAVIGTGFLGNIGLTYYQAGCALVPAFGRDTIMGADINKKFGSVGLTGEWAQTSPNDALKAFFPLSDDNNTAWNANLNFTMGNLAIGAGYTTVETQYAAPGYWSRLGRAVNLTNVKGPSANLSYALGSRVTLTAEGQFLQPNTDGSIVSGRTSIAQGRSVVVGAGVLDKITAWKAGLKYGLTAANSVDLGWEEVMWQPVAGNDTNEKYLSLGFGHDFNPNSSLKLLYQIVQLEQGVPTPYAPAVPYRGGVATAQFQLKY